MNWLACLLLMFLCAAPVFAQTATLRGIVTDESGGLVPGATLTLTNASGSGKQTTSAADGSYSFLGVPAGDYTLNASAPQLVLPSPVQLSLSAGVHVANLQLNVAATSQQLTVKENAAPAVTTESGANASALVMQGEDLKSLGDDPEDLAADLQALAGPSAGPSGGAVFIDGFSRGQIPSKDSISAIRINQNPFSPEYDTLGYGRIEITTKPGADKFHGDLHDNFGDSIWNSRNPYAAQKAPFFLQEYGGSLEGPLSKKASFFMVVDGAAINNGAIIDGTTLDSNTLAILNPFTQVFEIPQRRIIISPRVDAQVTPTDTLSAHYIFENADIQHSGVGGFNLVSTGFHNHSNDKTVQLANTKLIGTNAVNEARFQFNRAYITSASDNLSPQIDVLNSFVGGGAQVGNSSNSLDSFEFQDYTTLSRGSHTWRFGVRVRAATLANTSPINFGGTFTFGGGIAPELNASNQPVLDSSGNPVLLSISSIESYRRTLVFQQMGFSSAQIRALGGGASQFSINAGNPALSVNQEDVGAFVGDDWRAKRNLTISLGLRYEGQTNIHHWLDFAPRVGFAWAPGGKNGNGKTVLRGGFGMFYQRFDIVSFLTSERYNGVVQQQYVINDPAFYPVIPSVSSLAASGSQQAMEELSPNLRAPYLMDSAIGVERQLPAHTTVAVTYLNSHGLHQFLTNDINAPLPGTYSPQSPGVYPMGNPNAVFLVESAGLYNQDEVIANVNARLSDSVSLFGSYAYNHAMSNTDYTPPPQNTDFNPAISFGGIGVGSFPANPYSMAGEYGPASTDIQDQVTFGGSIAVKWGFSLNPLIVYHSGAPFDITVGQDLYGDTLFNGRPGIATDAKRPGLVATSYGLLDPNPIPGETILTRNSGRGPGILLANLRIQKTLTFGPAAEGSVSTGGEGVRGLAQSPFGGGPGGGSRRTGHLYNLTIAMAVRNILNHNNPGPIIGNIESPLFGQANQPYGINTLGGTGFSESADNRRLELQMRLSF
jgi:hypothetical protein